MQAILPPPALGEGNVAPEVPSFIHEIPGMQGKTTNPFELFNFWAPDRLGDEDCDYATGRRHFMTAIAYARASHSENFLANIVSGMCNSGAGPMERGFLEMLASKATYGSIPPPISEEMAAALRSACGKDDDEIRHGEAEARTFLDIARDCQCPEMIFDCLVAIVNREMSYGALTFMWAVCWAAYAGSFN